MANKIKSLVATYRRLDATSAELAVALDGARAEVVAAKEAAALAEQSYTTGLLDADDEALAVHLSARNTATINLDRAIALASSIELRLDETRVAEAAAALEAERKSVDTQAQAVGDLIRTRYPKLATEMVSLFKRISEADRAVSEMNKKLISAGRRQDILSDTQSRGLPEPKSSRCLPHSIWGATILLEIEGFAPGWEVNRWNQDTI